MAIQPKTWITKDFHVHESHSADAPEATIKKYCAIAEKRGIDEIAFTTHLILRGPDIKLGLSPHNISEYLDKIHTAQDSTSILLRSGLEVDYFPQEERNIEKILDEHYFDFILGSLHYVQGIDIGSSKGSKEFFKGRHLEDALNIYFNEFTKAVESGLFDVMAHPDYFRRYLEKGSHIEKCKPIHWNRYGSNVFKAIDSLKSYDIGIEVNASGWRHEIKDVYPMKSFIETAKKNGIKKVTIGSDSHDIYELGENTDKALKRLEEAGYNYLNVFNDRKNKKIPLLDVKTKDMDRAISVSTL